METTFKQISEIESGQLDIQHETKYSPFGMSPFMRQPIGKQIKSLSLTIEYNGHIILLSYLLSNDHMGTIECTLSDEYTLPTFHITHTNPYKRLLVGDTKALKVNSDDITFIDFVNSQLKKIGLEEIAIKSAFEPEINGEKTSLGYTISTKYSLAFPEKKEVLHLLITFYKAMIDYAIP